MDPVLDLNTLERELCRIPEVTAARVVAGVDGVIEEVHILALASKHAKQVVRDVQSVAMAAFGVDLDRRIVSVVQLDAVTTPPLAPAVARADDVGSGNGESANGEHTRTESENGEPTRAESENGARDEPHAPRAAVFETPRVHDVDEGDEGMRISVGSVSAIPSGTQAIAQVVLTRGDDRATGTADGLIAGNSIQRFVAQATIAALRLLEPAAARADVEAASVVNIGGRQVAIASVILVVPPYEEVCAGAAVVRAAGELDAVARAVLAATNRRLPHLH